MGTGEERTEAQAAFIALKRADFRSASELVVFDDSIEHEAWNLSQELRVVLLFDVWRRELSAEERALVAALLTAVSQFDGAEAPWAD